MFNQCHVLPSNSQLDSLSSLSPTILLQNASVFSPNTLGLLTRVMARSLVSTGGYSLVCPNCTRCSSCLRFKPFSLPLKGNYNHDVRSVPLGLNHYHPLALPEKRFARVHALESDLPRPLQYKESSPLKRSQSYQEWDSWSGKFAAAANLPFLLLQMPQIVLNAQNLLAGNKSALLAVPWLGMLTGLLGNLSLLSYFAKKREKEAVLVQALGVISTYIVVSQLAIAEAMPLPYFLSTSAAVASGLILNLLNYFHLLHETIWRLWEDCITIGGLSVLSQIMWSTFVPYVPNSVLPGGIAFSVALAAVVLSRMGKLSESGVRFVGAISGWTATLLFMWMPVAQLWTNLCSPENIKGLSAYSMLLAMLGNGLMLPRALLIRDFMWFTGSSWGTVFYGYGNILCLYMCSCISRGFFLGATFGLVLWFGLILWKDTVVHEHPTPFTSLKELILGS